MTISEMPLRILLVEDTAFARWSLAQMLTSLGHSFVDVPDGREGLANILKRGTQ